MKRSIYFGFTLSAITLSLLISPNVFAAETPEAAAAYASAKASAATAQEAVDSLQVLSLNFSVDGTTNASKATQKTLAYKIAVANSSARSATTSASQTLHIANNQTVAAKDLSLAAVKYLALAGVICPTNSTCPAEAQAASQSAVQTSAAFTAAVQAATSMAATSVREAKLYQSEASAYTAAAKAGRVSMSALIKTLSKANSLAKQQDGRFQTGSPEFDTAKAGVTSFDASYASYQQTVTTP